MQCISLLLVQKSFHWNTGGTAAVHPNMFLLDRVHSQCGPTCCMIQDYRQYMLSDQQHSETGQEHRKYTTPGCQLMRIDLQNSLCKLPRLYCVVPQHILHRTLPARQKKGS